VVVATWLSLEEDRNWGFQAFEVLVGVPLLRGQAPSAAFEFVFIIASTSRSIENYLATHRIRRSGVAKAKSTSSDGQTAMSRYLQYDLDNPHHQQLIERLKGLYNQKVSNLRLMNWIVNHNLPFRLVATRSFRLLSTRSIRARKFHQKGRFRAC
jgi:hypothetical protein